MINRKILDYYCEGGFSKIENYEQALQDKKQTWDVHHRLEIGSFYRLSSAELKGLGLYYKRPPEELILLTFLDHRKVHRKLETDKVEKRSFKMYYLEKELLIARAKIKNKSVNEILRGILFNNENAIDVKKDLIPNDKYETTAAFVCSNEEYKTIIPSYDKSDNLRSLIFNYI